MADVFRKNYTELSALQKSDVASVKDKAQELYDLLDKVAADPRSIAVAKTNLEQSIMWAVKGITT